MKTCPNCNSKNQEDATFCFGCGYDLVKTASPKAENPSDLQAKPCPSCGGENPPNAKFCSHCGAQFGQAGVQGGASGGKTMFFGAMQEKGRAKLILIKGGGFEGVSYNLNATDHVTGREEGFILFPEDPYCSPKHANFFYFGGKFFVSDENSLNGVYVRIKSPIELKDGMTFRVGEQVFRANYMKELPRLEGYRQPEDGTEFLGSPSEFSPALTLTHILESGRIGSIIYPNKETFTIGREACDLNYPTDGFMSGKHARITKSGSKFFLADNGSKNGTYYRIRQEQELFHGDYVFIGQQLLRVEITQ
jgi:pSer/pThr/pTyr-binding forkhead associated (FHA) protein/ribosomal protein L40E